MGEPCIQENSIGRLTATTEQIGVTLERLLTVLDKVASQGERLNHLDDEQKTLVTRVREIELNAEREKVKVGIIMGGISVVTSAITAFFTGQIKG